MSTEKNRNFKDKEKKIKEKKKNKGSRATIYHNPDEERYDGKAEKPRKKGSTLKKQNQINRQGGERK
jgi:hypothetical protein